MTPECAEKTLGDDFFLAQDIRVETSAFISRDRVPLSGMQDIKTWVFVIIWISVPVFPVVFLY